MFILIDGPDGVGKTTQVKLLADRLENLTGRTVVRLKEPTDGVFGKEIRRSASGGRHPPVIETALFMADRISHVHDYIKPALRDLAKILVLDRYYYSTAAYQGAAGMDTAEILLLNQMFCPEPDLIFFLLTTDPTTALERISKRNGPAPRDFFETLPYQRKVHFLFRRIAQDDDRIREITTDRDEQTVHEAIWEQVKVAFSMVRHLSEAPEDDEINLKFRRLRGEGTKDEKGEED